MEIHACAKPPYICHSPPSSARHSAISWTLTHFLVDLWIVDQGLLGLDEGRPVLHNTVHIITYLCSYGLYFHILSHIYDHTVHIFTYLCSYYSYFICVYTVHIVGKNNGRVFEDRDVKFILGEGSEVRLVEGIEIALGRMNQGEKARIKVKAVYAYGSKGNSELNILPNTDLVYEVELKNIEFVSLTFVYKLIIISQM